MKNFFFITPYHYDHTISSVVQGLQKLKYNVFSNSDHNYVVKYLQKLNTQVKAANMSDVVILSHSALELKYKNLIQPLLKEVDKIDIFLDGSDSKENEADPNNFKLYLKRELVNRGEYKNIEPLIFAAEDRYFNYHDFDFENIWNRKNDNLVCIMSSCEKRPWRFDIMNSLKENFSDNDKFFIGEYRQGDTIKFDTGDRHYSGYFNKLLNSKISVDAYGAFEARQTGRFWESIANGCCLFYQPIEPHIWPNGFEDGKNIVIYSDEKDLVEKVKYYINNEDELKQIAKNGYEHMMKFHRTENRGEEFIRYCETYL